MPPIWQDQILPWTVQDLPLGWKGGSLHFSYSGAVEADEASHMKVVLTHIAVKWLFPGVTVILNAHSPQGTCSASSHPSWPGPCCEWVEVLRKTGSGGPSVSWPVLLYQPGSLYKEATRHFGPGPWAQVPLPLCLHYLPTAAPPF